MHVGAGTAQTQTMIDAARSAGVNRVVLLSSIGARLIPLAGFIPGRLPLVKISCVSRDWTLLSATERIYVECTVVGRWHPREELRH